MKQLTVRDFGTLKNGEKAHLYIMENEKGVTAAVTDYGAALVNLLAPDKNGSLLDVVLGFDDVSGYENGTECFGASVGRSANRIAGAEFQLNGVTYQLAKNEKGNSLHSGPDLWFKRLWTVTDRGDDHVTFVLHSPDGDQGYPGNASISVSYTLMPDNGVSLEYHMVSDADTIANFTNHAYFNLRGHDSGSILDHQVWIDADFFTPADEVSIPVGQIAPVKDTPMDFTVMKPVGRDIDEDYDQLKMAGGYDHNWVLNHKPGELALCAKAYDPVSGRIMEVYTDLPGMQFYTANSIKADPVGKGGAVYGPRSGYCFETQYYPDAVNKPQFPSPVLKAGETYSTTTVYKFLRE